MAAPGIADLDELSGPVLPYGGPYSNLHATRALFDLADARGIAPENRICTGDAVACCADPQDIARLVAAARAMRTAGQADGYAKRLLSGV